MQKMILAFLAIAIPIFTYGCTGGTDNTTATTIKILFNNQSDLEVDPHFYRSDKILTANELFASPANLYQNFNGKTTIPAKTSVEVDLPVDQVITIGSNQAAFGSLITFTGGKSSEKPILIQPTDFSPGKRITFTFSHEASGYHTTTSVASQ